jgi:maltokinase
VVEERALRASRNHLLLLDATHAVRVVAGDVGHRAEPVTASGDDWVRSTPGDGAGLAVLHRLRNRMAVEDGFRVTMQAWVAPDDESERAMGVDQTNESWVVGGTLVVKWVTGDLDGPHPAADRMRRLAEAGFAETPTLVGLVEWQDPDGEWAPVAVVQEYLPGAQDGWTWVVSEVRRALGLGLGLGLEPGEPVRWGEELGRLTAMLHLALVPASPEAMSDERARAQAEDAAATLAEAVRLTSAADPGSHALLVEHRDELEEALGAIGRVSGGAATPIHGDLHVGQVLRTPDGRLHVIDFDGNPTRPPALRVGLDVVERDLAGMWLAVQNVGNVVRHHTPEADGEAVGTWVRETQGDFLAAYQAHTHERWGFREEVFDALVIEQNLREFVYAARHLPRWGYVPAANLRAAYA